MKLLEQWFKKSDAETVLLIDIAPDSVAGAYVRYEEHSTPVMVYARRLPLESWKGESKERALERSLETLGAALVSEGSPSAARLIGSGSVNRILVSVGAPWGQTELRTEVVERTSPFIFTSRLVATVLERTRVLPPGKMLGSERVIGTTLNGYETRKPYEKRARHAAIIVLTSHIDESVANTVTPMLTQLYHTREISYVATAMLRAQTIRTVFPHEPDALVCDASSASLTVALMHRGLTRVLIEMPRSTDSAAWVPLLEEAIGLVHATYSLPQTVFLIAGDVDTSALRRALDTATLTSLWSPGKQPKRVVPVLAGHGAGLVNLASDVPSDLPLLMMALYPTSGIEA